MVSLDRPVLEMTALGQLLQDECTPKGECFLACLENHAVMMVDVHLIVMNSKLNP